MTSATQNEVLALLVSGHSPTETAARVAKSVSSIYRLLRRPDFSARLHEAKAAELQPHAAKLRTATGEAIDTLIDLMRDLSVNASSRIRAAIAIAELSLKYSEYAEVLPRLAAVEQVVRDHQCPTCAADEPPDE